MMKSCGFKLVYCVLVLAVSVELVACGHTSGTSYSSLSETMAGSWDFTVTNAKGRIPFVIEATLNQDHHGNISATASVTANGPTGNASTVFIVGPSLSAPYPVYLDYLGFTCDGTDTGDRSVTGSINSSNLVTLNWNVGGSEVVTITGTMNHAANPQFSGTFTSTGRCGGGHGTIVGNWLASVRPGNYAGTSTVDSAEAISLTLSGTNGPVTGNGTDSKLGSFTLTGNSIGDFLSATITYATSPGNNGPVFGYFDPQFGSSGSILLLNYVGQNATTCPNGEPFLLGTCEIAILALP